MSYCPIHGFSSSSPSVVACVVLACVGVSINLALLEEARGAVYHLEQLVQEAKDSLMVTANCAECG